jgi:hypothetical protein
MKTKLILLFAALIALSGCTTASLAKKAADFERLGITQAVITGKFSNTEYTVERGADGKRRAVLQHSNIWVPKVLIIRETGAPEEKE